MRRLIVEDPMSRSATWALRLAWVALAAFVLSGALVRFGRLDLEPGLAALAAACLLAVLALLLTAVAFARIWVEGHLGFGRALGAMVLAGLVLVYPAMLAARAFVGPPFLDVTTDPVDALAFSASRPALDARAGWRPETVAPGLRERQRAARPRIVGLELPLPEDVAFELARRAAEARGFAVVEASAPGGRTEAGRIEARARTLVLAAPVEITVRVRPTRRGARIDVRAVTRAPVEDLGGAPETIVGYLADIEAEAGGL